ncbi:MAG: tRNA lysidine(34) synthetase TilS [Nitrospira sp.]|nr:tRNA lysidine(34) synthetase TilS [Nitrospira sp.]MDH4242929.1 tRNA lysidine(34) synthetase TilS [Nitrospira sp.]MDH4355939.1 tRNA lysidine(34) synthetase TilS [Nitrospira sp.]
MVRTVRTSDLFHHRHHLLVAVSGGPDSMALLSLLDCLRPEWSLTLTAVHCNYGLRGSESEGDQEFVTTRCGELNIPLHVRRLHLHERSKQSSLQAAARHLRYQAFSEIAEQCGADRIVLGHTADDQAETILLWLLRGTGLTGLAGMPADRDGGIVRPLYETGRQDILSYLRNSGLPFRNDSSNSNPLYLRNRIRHELVPVLKRLAPASLESLRRFANICREDDRYLDQQAAALFSVALTWESEGGWTVDRTHLLTFPHSLQRRGIRNVIRQSLNQPYALGLRTVDRVLQLAANGKVGSLVDVRGGHVIVTDRHLRFVPHDKFWVAPDRDQSVSLRHDIGVPGSLMWPGTGQRLHVQPLAYRDAPAQPERDRIVVDAACISQPLIVRNLAPGDRFQPCGMDGHSKKLQDFFTDLKIPKSVRSRIPLVVAPEGIVWVVGYRQDRRWLPTAETERCLVFTVDDPPLREGTA